MDKVDLASQGKVERRLAEMGLLNLDEFDKFSPAKMPLLKNLMQMASLSLCKAYQKNYRALPRIASLLVRLTGKICSLTRLVAAGLFAWK